MAVELKGNVSNIPGIIEQLQYGAQMLEGDPDGEEFRALLIKKGGIRGSMANRLLKAARITFRGQRFPVGTYGSGKNLAEIV